MKTTTQILLCMLISVASYNAHAQQPTSGTFGELNWNLTDNVLTISGTGEMPDSTRLQAYPWNGFFEDEGAFINNRPNIHSIVIEEGVTTIGSHAFRGPATAAGHALTSVTLPNTLTIIGENAFRDARILPAIVIPAGVTVIDSAAFRNNNLLASVTFAGTSQLEIIGAEAFQPATVAGGNTMFSTFTIPPSVHTIGNNAFRNVAVTSIVIPPSVQTIGTSAFEGSHLTSFNVPTTVTSWGGRVFAGTRITSAADVDFGAGLTHIPDGMFSNINLTSMDLPATIESIGAGAFAVTTHTVGPTAISGIASFTFPPLVTEIADNLFNKSGAAVAPSLLTSITIPNTITRIGSSAFASSRLTTVTIPGSVKYIGTGAFNNSVSLTSVTLNEGLDTIQMDAFRNISTLRTVNIPSTVTYLGANLFWSSLITSPIVIPEGVTVVRENSFRNTRIPSVVIGNSVTTIEMNAFSGVGANHTLTSIEIGTGIETIGLFAFSGNTNNLGIVTVRAAVPPVTPGADTLSGSVFGSPTIPERIILIVADEPAIAAYEEAPIWQNFMLITTSISDGITALRNEIADLTSDLGEVEHFFGTVVDLLDIDVEGLGIGDIFWEIGNAIDDLMEDINTLETQLSTCQTDLSTCQTNLSTCQADLATCEANQSSVQGHSGAMLLEVYPNPVTNEVRITNEWAFGDRVEIFNSHGQNVFSQQGGAPGTTSELVINMSSFPAGTYIVRVGNRIARIVKL